MADNELFRREWARFRGEALPLGFMMRDGRHHWLRLHALPQSQRYAHDAGEYATILARANTLGTELLGQGGECWLIRCTCASPSPDGWGPAAMKFDDGDEELTWAAHVGPIHWLAGAFDPLLLSIADDEADPTMWMNRSTGALFSPYDGGFDLFPDTDAAVHRLKKSYGGWLSPHPDGL